MADDELIIPIDKAFWPKGVARGLMPLLRSLGDKHGNLVIVAAPNKHIMVKGPQKGIDAVKPELKELIAVHFPDAPTPPELAAAPLSKTSSYPAHENFPRVPSVEEPPAPAAAPLTKTSTYAAHENYPSVPSPAAAPAKRSGFMSMFSRAPAGAAAPGKASEPVKAVTGRKRPPTSVPSALLWECTRNNSSFIRNPYRQFKVPFSAEPCNILAMHSASFSGIASTESVDVRSKKSRKGRETVELAQSHARSSRLARPPRAVVTKGLSKCTKKGLQQIHTELSGRHYRKAMQELAELKYTKIKHTFKKKKVIVKSRRSKKSE
jgi:hypothetical protein